LPALFTLSSNPGFTASRAPANARACPAPTATLPAWARQDKGSRNMADKHTTIEIDVTGCLNVISYRTRMADNRSQPHCVNTKVIFVLKVEQDCKGWGFLFWFWNKNYFLVFPHPLF
jgi:hypothetical protein